MKNLDLEPNMYHKEKGVLSAVEEEGGDDQSKQRQESGVKKEEALNLLQAVP